jgi:hypothetical protein
MHGTDTIPPTNTQDLAELARQIRQAHAAVRQASLTALDRALAAGDALITAQAKVSSKNWKTWLRENCFLGISTACLYQQLARHRTEIEAELERVPHLSLRAARLLIAKPKGEAEEVETEKKTAKSSPTLLDHWKRASDAERTGFLDNIGVDGIRRTASLDLLRKLREQTRVERVEETNSNPNASITALVGKALSHIVAADAPQTSKPVADGNINEALASLRAVLKKLGAIQRTFHDISVGISAGKARATRRAA